MLGQGRALTDAGERLGSIGLGCVGGAELMTHAPVTVCPRL